MRSCLNLKNRASKMASSTSSRRYPQNSVPWCYYYTKEPSRGLFEMCAIGELWHLGCCQTFSQVSAIENLPPKAPGARTFENVRLSQSHTGSPALWTPRMVSHPRCASWLWIRQSSALAHWDHPTMPWSVNVAPGTHVHKSNEILPTHIFKSECYSVCTI